MESPLKTHKGEVRVKFKDQTWAKGIIVYIDNIFIGLDTGRNMNEYNNPVETTAMFPICNILAIDLIRELPPAE
jgi:hypothetical protein